MSKRFRVLLAVNFGISAAIALTVWLLGFDGAANAIGLITAAIGLGSALLGWLVPNSGLPNPPVSGDRRSGDRTVGGRTAESAAVGADPASVEPLRRAAPAPANPSAASDAAVRAPAVQRRRWAFALVASLVPVLVITGVTLMVRKMDDGTPSLPRVAPDTSSPQPSPAPTGATPPGAGPASTTPPASGAPDTVGPTGQITPVVDPPPPPSPTQGKPGGRTTPRPDEPEQVAQPWMAPAGTPEWTLYDTDGVRFLPRPTYLPRVGSAELAFQLNMHQINWYQWTDSDDLSYQGCRSSSVKRWDGLKLDDFSAPRTYCRQEPDDPSAVSYVRFTAKDMNADPPYVKVRVWVYRP